MPDGLDRHVQVRFVLIVRRYQFENVSKRPGLGITCGGFKRHAKASIVLSDRTEKLTKGGLRPPSFGLMASAFERAAVRCTAFPDGVLLAIASGDHHQRERFDGDRRVQWFLHPDYLEPDDRMLRDTFSYQ
ncbi:MAG: hypothetical protein P3C09_14360 [Gemmatimonadota bacterium]|nr:hypothetical protein [Gemmatimonadota bacterium]